jgi:NDP-sugar pyrophosphorylase family protein
MSLPTAVILAGGLGTRLRSVVSDRPKVLAPVRGRPFLAHLLDRLDAARVWDVVLATGYQAGQIRAAFGGRYRGLRLHYSEEPQPLGTGGALARALPLATSDPVLVLNGDSLCHFDLEDVCRTHEETEAAGTLVVTKVPDAGRYGSVQVGTDRRIIRFAEKDGSGRAGLVNAGIYLLSQRLLASIPCGVTVSLERELLPAWIDVGLVAHVTAAALLDIGTPDAYAAAQEVLAPDGHVSCRRR